MWERDKASQQILLDNKKSGKKTSSQHDIGCRDINQKGEK